METVQLHAEYLKAVNYALCHDHIPVCQFVELTNVSGAMLHDVQVSCAGEYITSYAGPLLAHLGAGQSVRDARFELKPDASRLVGLTERVSTSFVLTVTAAGEVVSEQTFPIDLMPYDHWLGTSILPQTLVSFVTPNHPAISALLLKAAVVLKELTGSSAFNAYQTGNVNDVRMQVAAIYAALHQHGIIYRSVPASYEEVGQRITMPDQVLSAKVGNCLELTLLFASVLESVGINCGIVLLRGHAFLCVWLVDDSLPYSLCDDASAIEKKCSRGIDEMLVLECTQVAQEKTAFESAVRHATQTLADHSRFEMMIDVRRSRLERFLPLPTRVMADGEWSVEQEGVGHDTCVVDVEEHDRYDLSHLRESKRELTKFDIWERKLLDFSLRNSLLNLYLRRKAIQFISFDIDKLEDHLQDGEEYVIEAKPAVEFKADGTERLMRSKLLSQLRDLVREDIGHHRLHTFQSEAETMATLKNIYRAARNAIEETGANSLFLTIGTLRWYETALSETPRFAPLLLLPVEMVYKKGKYYIRTREEDISLNVTLIEFLRQNYDIRVKGLDPLPTDAHGVDVPLIFAAIRDALKEQRRWDVEEECLLGTFSFSKFLMWNDVHNNREQLSANAIVSSLVENRLTWTPEPLTTDLRTIDEQLKPNELALPVAVDSSQMAAVIEGGLGHSFILYGPPGTGKSQTITNLIANALYQGKRVLFVAEKMAALSVVQSRLAKIGLDPFCLELHSNKSSKRHVLEQLDKALKVTHIVSPADYAVTAERIYAERCAMIEYLKALHDVSPEDGLSLYDCILRYESIDAEPLEGFVPTPQADHLLASEGVKGIEQLLGDRLETIVRLVGQPSQHPLNGLRIDKEQVMTAPDFTETMSRDAAALAECMEHREELADCQSLRDTLLRDNTESLLTADARALYNEWRSIRAKWILPKFFAKRSYMEKLRAYNPNILEEDIESLFDRLLGYQRKHHEIERVREVMHRYFGTGGVGPSHLGWRDQADVLPGAKVMEEAVSCLKRWAQHADKMRDWLHWSAYATELTAHGLGCAVSAFESGEWKPAQLRESYLKALFRQKAQTRISSSPTLVTFEGLLFDEQVRRYRKLTEEFQLLTQKELYARLAARVPRVTEGIDSSSEIGLLNRNVSNGGRGLSLRDLFDQIPTLLPRLCPCMLMSPMSVAQYLDLGSEKFDLVVFDEASQMPTSEAVGAIARGKSLIVVGDPKQMPPTSFFSSTSVDEEEASIDDMESILEDCRTLEMPSLQLNWHYRSRHESLIAFSNNEYYDSQLITFPSVDDQQTKVRLVPVGGYYDKGGKRSNRAEADAIVAEIARRLADPVLSRQSIGVIAFSVVQQGLIEDVLQELLDSDRTLREAADAMYEPIFVKNLENVQGDERDVILFSIGYGPDKDGHVSMNFGPLNNAGGERRLNVAVSRARQEMLVFSTLRAAQIDLRRSQARGVEGLKHFLEYAETQQLATSLAAGEAAAAGACTLHDHHHDVLIADQIARAVEAGGYVTRTHVGRSQFKVDVAVSLPTSPDVYRLGILLDGEGYRDTQTTRDREMVQPSVLTGLRWRVMRVWSVDWFNNRQRVLDRIFEQLQTEPDDDPQPEVRPVFDVTGEEVEETASLASEYETCEIEAAQALRMTDQQLVEAIVSAEQPVTFMRLCRRVCALRGMPRITPALQRGLSLAVDQTCFTAPDREDAAGGVAMRVIWRTEADSQDYRTYRPAAGRDIADIPMVEIRNAVREAITEQVSLQADNLVLVVARKLGFTRRGTTVAQAITAALDGLKANGEVMESETGHIALLGGS